MVRQRPTEGVAQFLVVPFSGIVVLSSVNGAPRFLEGLLPLQRTDVILIEGFAPQPTVGIPQSRKVLRD